MVLVDTSVWIDFLKNNNSKMQNLLSNSEVAIHPLIICELCCGNLKDRRNLISLLHDLPRSLEASHEEVLHFIENNTVSGKGIGAVDIHLTCSAIISNHKFWTRDKRLSQLCSDLKIAF